MTPSSFDTLSHGDIAQVLWRVAIVAAEGRK
jgi:hypothetical protein